MSIFLHYAVFFLRAVLCTLGPVVLCGLFVGLIRRLFCTLVGGNTGRGVIIATSVIGTPVHELGHAAMCLVFGHKITEMALWQPRSGDGRLGYVTHRYNPRNPYQQIGNLFIGVGPIFSGLLTVTLCLWAGFPHTLSSYLASSRALVARGDGVLSVFSEGLGMIPHMWREAAAGGRPLWLCVILVIVILMVSQHISLSPEDIKGAARAIPLYALLLLILTVVVALIGGPAVLAVGTALQLFAGYTTALFVLVLVASLLQLIPALLIFLVRKLAGR